LLVQELELNCVFAVASKPEGIDVNWVELDPRMLPQSLEVAPEFSQIVIPNDCDPARITRFIRTSGTTGAPKLIALSRGMVPKRLFAHYIVCEGAGSNRHLLSMPPGTIAGYGFLLMALLRGATVTPWLNGDDFDALIDRFHISHLLLAPIAFHDIVISNARKGCSFSSVCCTTTGGAPFESQLANKARSVLGPNIWNGYTSTEAGFIARGHLNLLDTDPNIIGKILPFVNLQIVDEQDNPVPVGETGIVKIATELAVDHYVNSTDEDGVFRNGYIYPGDLGAVDDKGYLKILGRADGLINVRGLKAMPENIEH
jgi:acyl-coenzyme A synthetase/AMP-(fatty) acid ligase